MSDEQEPRSIFTFRIACDEIKRVGMHLSSLTSQVRAVGDSIGSTQVAIDKKRRELRALIKNIATRKKVLEKLRKRAEQASIRSPRSSKAADTTVRSADEVDTTYATEDMSITLPESVKSPSPLKRKRFAGIWDDIDVEILDPHADKRARMDDCVRGDECKENVAPEPESGPSRIESDYA